MCNTKRDGHENKKPCFTMERYKRRKHYDSSDSYHTGPVTTGLLAGKQIPLYIDFLIRKVATAIAMAQKNLREARIKVGRGNRGYLGV